MARYRLIQWRDLPSLVEAMDGIHTVRVPLSQRFQDLIDALAMREDATESEAYLEGWAPGPETERPGDALTALYGRDQDHTDDLEDELFGEELCDEVKQALDRLGAAGLNLRRIASRPTDRRGLRDLFFLDVDGHRDDPGCRAALDALAGALPLLKVLGSYPRDRAGERGVSPREPIAGGLGPFEGPIEKGAGEKQP